MDIIGGQIGAEAAPVRLDGGAQAALRALDRVAMDDQRRVAAIFGQIARADIGAAQRRARHDAEAVVAQRLAEADLTRQRQFLVAAIEGVGRRADREGAARACRHRARAADRVQLQPAQVERAIDRALIEARPAPVAGGGVALDLAEGGRQADHAGLAKGLFDAQRDIPAVELVAAHRHDRTHRLCLAVDIAARQERAHIVGQHAFARHAVAATALVHPQVHIVEAGRRQLDRLAGHGERAAHRPAIQLGQPVTVEARHIVVEHFAHRRLERFGARRHRLQRRLDALDAQQVRLAIEIGVIGVERPVLVEQLGEAGLRDRRAVDDIGIEARVDAHGDGIVAVAQHRLQDRRQLRGLGEAAFDAALRRDEGVAVAKARPRAARRAEHHPAADRGDAVVTRFAGGDRQHVRRAIGAEVHMQRAARRQDGVAFDRERAHRADAARRDRAHDVGEVGRAHRAAARQKAGQQEIIALALQRAVDIHHAGQMRDIHLAG